MKTTIHFYNFNLANPIERYRYWELFAELISTPGRGRWLNTFAIEPGNAKPQVQRFNGETHPITLKPEHLFDNQWNSGEFGRVFDWRQPVPYPKTRSSYVKGHYLDITPEMIELRASTYVCRYCGKHYHGNSSSGFCNKCISSEYLTPEHFPNLRLTPIQDTRKKMQPMTSEEFEALNRQYEIAQQKRRMALMEKLSAKASADRSEAITKINQGLAANLHLLKHGIDCDNIISYKPGEFTFGWRNPLTKEQAETIWKKIKPFPYKLQFKLINDTTTVFD